MHLVFTKVLVNRSYALVYIRLHTYTSRVVVQFRKLQTTFTLTVSRAQNKRVDVCVCDECILFHIIHRTYKYHVAGRAAAKTVDIKKNVKVALIGRDLNLAARKKSVNGHRREIFTRARN